jgi:hypothetical protein
LSPFTLVMAYYENPGMLLAQSKCWRAMPRDIRQHLHVVIVDDGSPKQPAREAFDSTSLGDFLPYIASFQVWRMGVDVRWNQDACRNVGVREAPTKWVLLTDMDHVVPAATWSRLMTQKLSKGCVYRFGRVSAPDLAPYKLHPNSWALTRDQYWAIGGYDEALAGNYGTDGDFLVRTRRHIGDPVQLDEVLIRYPREVIPDASTTTLARKSFDDKARISRLIAARKNTPDWKPLHFSFPCERVL